MECYGVRQPCERLESGYEVLWSAAAMRPPGLITTFIPTQVKILPFLNRMSSLDIHTLGVNVVYVQIFQHPGLYRLCQIAV